MYACHKRGIKTYIHVYSPILAASQKPVHVLWSRVLSPHCSLYRVELQQAQWLSEKLGTGIALFQALSNLAINGERARGKDLVRLKNVWLESWRTKSHQLGNLIT